MKKSCGRKTYHSFSDSARESNGPHKQLSHLSGTSEERYGNTFYFYDTIHDDNLINVIKRNFNYVFLITLITF